MASRKNSFFYEFDTTKDGKLKWCFCVDVVRRLNFSNFGDVLIFDATHNTNQYDLIFAVFVGLNHHSQSIFMDFLSLQMNLLILLNGYFKRS